MNPVIDDNAVRAMAFKNRVLRKIELEMFRIEQLNAATEIQRERKAAMHVTLDVIYKKIQLEKV